jgi:hypothetical protein
MRKNKINKPHDPFRALAVKFTAKKFIVTEAYVRNAINGTAKGGRVEDIIKIYNEKYSEYAAAFVK